MAEQLAEAESEAEQLEAEQLAVAEQLEKAEQLAVAGQLEEAEQLAAVEAVKRRSSRLEAIALPDSRGAKDQFKIFDPGGRVCE